MTSTSEKPFLDFDTIEAPKELGVVEIPTSQDMLDLLREAVDDPQHFFLTNCIKVGARGPASFFQRPPGSAFINAGREAQYFNPPTPGKKLFLHCRVLNKAMKRDKPYVTFEAEVKDEDGLPIETVQQILMLRSEEVGRKWWAKPTKDTQIGAELTPVVRHMTFEKMVKFESSAAATGLGNARNHHSDHEAARRAGHREAIASAHMQISYLHTLLNQFFGPDWVKGGTMSLRFTRPIIDGDTLTYKGVVQDKVDEEGRTRLVIKVWGANQDGNMTCTGTASGLVD